MLYDAKKVDLPKELYDSIEKLYSCEKKLINHYVCFSNLLSSALFDLRSLAAFILLSGVFYVNCLNLKFFSTGIASGCLK